MNTKCVYTAVCGEFDTLRPVKKPNPEWDYIIFTDKKDLLLPEGWTKILYLEGDSNTPPRLKAKYPKILPHIYLPPQYDTSIWVDGAYEIIGDIEWIYGAHGKSDFAVCVHPSKIRNTIYEEAEEILKRGLDTIENVAPQMEKYQWGGFEGKFKNHIYQCGVLLRKHNLAGVKALMNKWMEEIVEGSIRDQLSFPYVMDKYAEEYGVNFVKMAQTHVEFVLKWHHHNSVQNNIYFISPYGFNKKIGDRLNLEIEALPEDAWIVITDQDCCFLIDGVGDFLNRVINRYPDTDLFGAYTNRLGLSYQRLPEVSQNNYNLLDLHEIAIERQKQYNSTCTDIDKPIAGFFMMFPKKTWEKHKFQSEIIDRAKIINDRKGVYFDWDFSDNILKSGGKVRLIEGLFMLHCYRLGKDIKDVRHLTSRI